jgi:hypothetical protein
MCKIKKTELSVLLRDLSDIFYAGRLVQTFPHRFGCQYIFNFREIKTLSDSMRPPAVIVSFLISGTKIFSSSSPLRV